MPVLDTWRGEQKPQGVRAFLGWAGLTVTDESLDVLDLLRGYMQRAAAESCGQCFPCRSGLKKMAAILERLCTGEQHPNDISSLTELATLVYNSARCDLGQTAPQPLLDVLNTAPHLLTAKVTAQSNYVSVVTAPCISACPSHVNVPDYIEKIRLGQFDKALQTVMDNCVMPGTIGRVCVRPCEAACKRGVVDAPLAIRHLKRFIADEDVKKHPYIKPKKHPIGRRKVAVAGAGPAGLSCAYYLAQHNYDVTIFEMQEGPGGMARYGIPDYRLPPPVLAREVDIITATGCTVKYGIGIGQDVTLPELEQQGFEAVFLGAGAPKPAKMYCEGEDNGHEGYITGIQYLAEAARGQQTVFGKTAVVIGGGNVAMDCVRTALRQGFTNVQLLYRRTLHEMPADHQEIHDAQEEGVIFNYLMAPTKIVAKNNKVTGIICQKMQLCEPDASGRCRPMPIEGEEVEFACDVIIPAIGQKAVMDIVLKNATQGLTQTNTLEADSITGQVSGRKKVFGGGDCVTGPDTLIAALAAGKRAAQHIDEYLQGKPVAATYTEKLQNVISSIGVVDAAEPIPFKGFTHTMPVKTLPPAQRILGVMEVEEGATTPEAIQEATRCLRCFRLALAVF